MDSYRCALKEKIASRLNSNNNYHPHIKSDESDILLRKASIMLKTAALKGKEMQEDMIKLANENIKLYNELCLIKKADEANEVVENMLDKGLIKKADVNQKINELVGMDEVAFSMFKEAIENVSTNHNESFGVDSLTFLSESNNIENRRTLADSLDDI